MTQRAGIARYRSFVYFTLSAHEVCLEHRVYSLQYRQLWLQARQSVDVVVGSSNVFVTVGLDSALVVAMHAV